jgi:hypothetical protein
MSTVVTPSPDSAAPALLKRVAGLSCQCGLTSSIRLTPRLVGGCQAANYCIDVALDEYEVLADA